MYIICIGYKLGFENEYTWLLLFELKAVKPIENIITFIV